MMNVVLVVKNKGKDNTWEETFVCADMSDDELWDKCERIIERFNASLKPGELPREVVEVYEDLEEKAEDDSPFESDSLTSTYHDWHKTNPVTIAKGASMYDTYRCERCGITGKRHGLNSTISIDRKYRNKKYRKCRE